MSELIEAISERVLDDLEMPKSGQNFMNSSNRISSLGETCIVENGFAITFSK